MPLHQPFKGSLLMVVSFKELRTAIMVSPFCSSLHTKTSELAKPHDAHQGDKPVHGQLIGYNITAFLRNRWVWTEQHSEIPEAVTWLRFHFSVSLPQNDSSDAECLCKSAKLWVGIQRQRLLNVQKKKKDYPVWFIRLILITLKHDY